MQFGIENIVHRRSTSNLPMSAARLVDAGGMAALRIQQEFTSRLRSDGSSNNSRNNDGLRVVSTPGTLSRRDHDPAGCANGCPRLAMMRTTAAIPAARIRARLGPGISPGGGRRCVSRFACQRRLLGRVLWATSARRCTQREIAQCRYGGDSTGQGRRISAFAHPPCRTEQGGIFRQARIHRGGLANACTGATRARGQQCSDTDR